MGLDGIYSAESSTGQYTVYYIHCVIYSVKPHINRSILSEVLYTSILRKPSAEGRRIKNETNLYDKKTEPTYPKTE